MTLPMLRRSAVSSVALFSIAWTYPACLAQAQAVSEAANEDQEAKRLAPVTVTARRKEESLQDTPISIQAFTADSLESRNVTDVSQIGEFTPNMRFDSAAAIGGSNSSAVIYIRGIGQDTALPTIDLGVGVYVDGVYLARSVGGVLDLVDPERVEVLRGPQGTLFGRNTIGGAVNITSTKPRDAFEADAELTIGDDNLVDVKGMINVPLVEDVLAMRASGQVRQRDGYVDRPDGTDLGNDDSFSGRVAFRYTPTERLTIDLAADYTDSDENGAPFVLLEVVETAAFPQFHNAFIAPFGECFFGPGGPPSPTGNPNCYNEQFVDSEGDTDFGTFGPKDELELWGVSFSAEYELNDNITLKSITSLRDTESAFAIDQDHSPLEIAHVETIFTQEQFSQEGQILGNFMDDRLDFILGAYYFQEEGETFELVTFSPVAFRSGGDFDNSSFALFGQATFDVTERLSVTGGLRYTEDTKRFSPDTFVISQNNDLVPPPLLGFGPGLVPPSPPPGTPILPSDEAEVEFEEVTPLVNLSYRFTDDFLGYVTYSEGFKSGGFTQRIFPPLPEALSYEPETVEVVEVGFKSTLLDNRVRFNGAAFHTDYTDLQFVVQDVTVAPVVRNAGAATIQGFELDLTAIPADGWLLEAGIGYINAEYDEVDPGTGVTTSNDLVKTPEWSSSLGLSYEIQLSPASTLTPRVDWTYSDSYFNNAINSPQIAQDAYHLINLGLTYRNEDNGLRVSLIGQNLSDEEYISAGFSDTVNLGTSEAVFDRGRQWQLVIGKSF